LKATVPAVEDPVASDAPGSDSDDSEDEGIEEEGLEKVMQLLGDDGLDETAQMQLELLNGDEDDEDDEDYSGSDGSASGEEGLDDGDEEDWTDEEEDAEDADVTMEETGESATKPRRSSRVATTSKDADADEDEDEGEDGIALDDLSDANLSLDADAVPRQKITVDNQVALQRVRETIRLDPSLPWTESLVCDYPDKIEVEDVNDDLNRELAFYKQALHSAKLAKELAAASKPPLPFTRPSDYYAEMVKSDAHMSRIRQRLLDETAGIKKGEEKRKEREMKKIGKQVQLEKLKERRDRGKEEVEKVKGLKRKRQNMDDPQDAFDVTLDDGGEEKRGNKRPKSGSGKISRNSRDQKYGFGGKGGRRAKQNTRESTEKIFGDGPDRKGKGKGGAFGGGRTKGKGGAAQRPGKGRRMAMNSRK